MKHATSEALDALELLLARLRVPGGLKETKRGVFYLKSRAFLHFHEGPAGYFCDVRLDSPPDFQRLPVNTVDECEALVANIADTLERHT